MQPLLNTLLAIKIFYLCRRKLMLKHLKNPTLKINAQKIKLYTATIYRYQSKDSSH